MDIDIYKFGHHGKPFVPGSELRINRSANSPVKMALTLPYPIYPQYSIVYLHKTAWHYR